MDSVDDIFQKNLTLQEIRDDRENFSFVIYKNTGLPVVLFIKNPGNGF